MRATIYEEHFMFRFAIFATFVILSQTTAARAQEHQDDLPFLRPWTQADGELIPELPYHSNEQVISVQAYTPPAHIARQLTVEIGDVTFGSALEVKTSRYYNSRHGAWYETFISPSISCLVRARSTVKSKEFKIGFLSIRRVSA